MITKLQIDNYKSLHNIELDVGRFNVLIGENGCGKSNILEAIAFAAAAAANKLDNEFLVSRGIRITEPKLMRSIFSGTNKSEQDIKVVITFYLINSYFSETFTLENNNEVYSKWTYRERKAQKKERKKITELIELFPALSFLKDNNMIEDWEIIDKEIESHNIDQFFTEKNKLINKIKSFIVYSPENTALRNFSKEGQIEPLGINGEGLLKLLTVIQDKAKNSTEEFTPLDDINESLELFDWYEHIKIPRDLSQAEQKITIKDRYLDIDFDQRSANEGFLFILFYIALMVSEDTPKIFAIDNIDSSLNPKLCTKLIKEMTRLAKKYDKQVFVTTHNPAILDGIDLGDDEQRLLVVSRNKQGHTRYKRIELKDKPRSSTNEELKLSEAFLRGYLGGLPKGF